jgi:hypothetical protein
MKFALGITALFAASAAAFTPGKTFACSSSLSSTTASETYTFTKSEEIFAEAKEVCVPYFCAGWKKFETLCLNP